MPQEKIMTPKANTITTTSIRLSLRFPPSAIPTRSSIACWQ